MKWLKQSYSTGTLDEKVKTYPLEGAGMDNLRKSLEQREKNEAFLAALEQVDRP